VIASHLSAGGHLAGVDARSAGLRVPGAFDGFEMAVRAILGQLVSVRTATALAGRLATRFGDPIETPFPELNRLSPSPLVLAEAVQAEMTALGISAPRAASIRRIAQAVVGRELDFQPGPDPESATRVLQTFPGIGDWTAQYIAMRALRWPDAFPAADLGLLKASGASSPSRLRKTAEAWRPWRAYAAMYLWESQHTLQPEQHDE
jgi:AraC family transcriptional regulator of adaptative response / DNA-3-methyladenine glycosylase II